ncbi:MAG: DUF5666 domain-containing protein [Acidobacteriaceae bacterium]
MRKGMFLLFVSAMMVSLLAGCGTTTTNPTSPSMGTVPVSLSMTDNPPAGVSVLFFQVSLTDASLTPMSGSAVSLISTPIQIDVTRLQTLSAFLSTANVSPGTYNSLSLTFANPQLVIFNASDQSIASTCAVGSVCQLTPTVDNAAPVTFSTAPFPVTVAANSPLGFLIDFHLNTVIQSDLSVNLGVANGVTVSELPPVPSHPQFGFLTGTVQGVNTSQNQFTLQTAYGRTFTITSNSSTTYDDFPSSACMTGSISCLATGQIVQVQIASIEMGGTLVAGQVTYLQAAGQQTAEGTIIGLNTSNGTTIMKLILHNNPSNNEGLPLGGEAAVTIGNGATFSVDANGFTIPAGLSFTGTSDLLVGQEVQVNVAAGSLDTSSGANNMGMGGWGPPRSLSFTTNSVELEPSQITGIVSAIDSGTSSFTLSSYASLFFAPWPFAVSNQTQVNVLTTAQTTYQGFSSDNFSGLAVKNAVSVSGWLFPPQSGATSPTLAAETVVLRSNGMF